MSNLNIRFEIEGLRDLTSEGFKGLEVLQKLRTENWRDYGSEPWDAKVPPGKRKVFRSAFRALRDLSEEYGWPSPMLKELKKEVVRYAEGWTISDESDTWHCHVIPENISITREGQKVWCPWVPSNRYTLLLDWGWNEKRFLNKNYNSWGHEKCSYEINGLTRDEIIVVQELIESGLISDNYWNAYGQLLALLNGSGLIDASWYEGDYDEE